MPKPVVIRRLENLRAAQNAHARTLAVHRHQLETLARDCERLRADLDHFRGVVVPALNRVQNLILNHRREEHR